MLIARGRLGMENLPSFLSLLFVTLLTVDSVCRVTKCLKKQFLSSRLMHQSCCVASKIFNEGISTDYLNNVRAVNGIVNENIFN